MNQPEIRFDDGAAYERFMGVWSRSVGEIFLSWLAPARQLKWLDVGCGNGAFTELLVSGAVAVSVLGVDPSDAQIDFARKRHVAGRARFEKGDAETLPVEDASFDAAVMALVIFFVKNPAKGVAEMVRAVHAGGSVSAYAWDLTGGGFPLHEIHEELAAMGVPPLLPPSPDASRRDALEGLWQEAGLVDVSTQEIVVERRFEDFEDLWATNMSGPRLSMQIAHFSGEQRQALRERVATRLSARQGEPITCSARAFAVKGRKPG